MWFPGSRKGSRIAGLLALSPALFSTTVTAADKCKAVSNAINTGVKKGMDPVYFPAKLAYGCLKALPLNKEYAEQTADGLLGFHEVISYQTYFKNPPTPELEIPVWDGAAEIQKIKDKVKSGKYQGLYDFVVDVYKIFNNYRDGHTVFMPTVLTVFRYAHPFSIVSVADGPTSTPKIWTLNEQRKLDKEVSEINGQPVVDYLVNLANSTLEDFGFADPDTRFNMLMSQFPTIAPEEHENMGYFQYVTQYPGDHFTIKYADGSTEKVVWSARLQYSETDDWLGLLKKGVEAFGNSMWLTGKDWDKATRKWTEKEALDYAELHGWEILHQMNDSYPDVTKVKHGSLKSHGHRSRSLEGRSYPELTSVNHFKPKGKRVIEKRDVEAMKKLRRKMKRSGYDDDDSDDDDDDDDGDDDYNQTDSTTTKPPTSTATDDGDDDDFEEGDTTTKLPVLTKTHTTHHTPTPDPTGDGDDSDDDDDDDDQDVTTTKPTTTPTTDPDDDGDDDDDDDDKYVTTTKPPTPTKTPTTDDDGDYDDDDDDKDVTTTKPTTPTKTPTTDDDGDDDDDDDDKDVTTTKPTTPTKTPTTDDDGDDDDDDDDKDVTTTKLPTPTMTSTTGPEEDDDDGDDGDDGDDDDGDDGGDDDDDDDDYGPTTTKPTSPTETPTTDTKKNKGYPEYFNTTSNGNFRFYILDKEVAVLDVSSFRADSHQDRLEASDLLDYGLDYIKAAGVKYLIIDLTNNGGGAAFLPFDFTRMLFPNRYIFESVNMRYTKQNYVYLKNIKLDAWWTTENKDWPSLEALFSPVERDGDKFTQMFRYDHLQITKEDGYGVDPTQKELYPAENIVVLGNGYCGSACFAWYESLYRQGVRSYVMGGRPNGLKYMQTSGGIKGGVVASFSTFINLKKFYEAFSDERAQKVAKILPGPLRLRGEWDALNIENQFRNGEEDQLPLEFRYTAACKRFSWTKEMMVDTGYTWRFIRDQAWSKDGKPTTCEKPYVPEKPYKPNTTTTHDKNIHLSYDNSDRVPLHPPPRPQKGHSSIGDVEGPPPHPPPHRPKPKPLHGDVIPNNRKKKGPVGDVTPKNPRKKLHKGQKEYSGSSPVKGIQDDHIPVKDRKPGVKEHRKTPHYRGKYKKQNGRII